MFAWWLVLLAPVLALPPAWWVSSRGYRLDDDVVYRPLPAWLLPVIVLVGSVLAAPFYLGRPTVIIVTYALALVWGGLLALIDLDVRRLPDVLTLPAYPVAAVLLTVCSAVVGDWEALARAAACAGLAVVLFTVIALVGAGSEGLGLGDVKLVGVLAGLLGWYGWTNAVLGVATGCVLGGLVAVALLVSGRAGRGSHVAYGPVLIAGAYVWAVLPPVG
ncbi:MAG TPA: A24 family peptidase [Microlunatus sp.]|nr:A24 family peptidase [Microlunatus sp.]